MSILTVRTGVDSRFLENVITRDISTQASIFDLVDNSIDAAKEYLNSHGEIILDEYGLPNDYSGFKIYIRLDKNSFKIIDNCFGIPDKTLESEALIVGKESSHDYGLGKYGIGLKRALLKFGDHYSLCTDTGEYAIKMQFRNTDFGQNKNLPAQKSLSRSRRKTLFVVSELKPLVIKEFENEDWLKKLKEELSDRYGIFLKKGLEIKLKPVNSKPIIIKDRFPEIVTHPHIPSRLCPKPIDVMGVKIFIEYGLHGQYNVGGGYGVNDLTNIAAFGWYVICNDRVIEIAVRDDSDYGWLRNWHNEYNGFIGLIRFNCQNVSLLPWDSTKTKITTDSLVFLEIKKFLSEFALKFRSDKKKYINYLKKNNDNNANRQNNTSDTGNTNTNTNTNTDNTNSNAYGQKRNKSKTEHTQQWITLLPKQFHQPSKSWILNNIIIEAKDLNIKSSPHAAALLYRSLLEETLLLFIKNTNSHEDVLAHYYQIGEGKNKSHSKEYMENQGISLAIASHWLFDNPDKFPKATKSKLRNATGRLRSHIKTLNSVVHCKHIMTDGELSTIRAHTFELLEFLVESLDKY
ncbi:ATP-binding protein [Serratia fonticola]|uniref:ATP-binding protein n=1 Tax=Serratia fonticola TaxID=47917 RepID=UPI0034C6775F